MLWDMPAILSMLWLHHKTYAKQEDVIAVKSAYVDEEDTSPAIQTDDIEPPTSDLYLTNTSFIEGEAELLTSHDIYQRPDSYQFNDLVHKMQESDQDKYHYI